MRRYKLFGILFLGMFFLVSFVNATDQQILVELEEYVDQNVLYNPLKSGDGIWYDLNENQSYYNITGYITLTNTNPNSKTISDIYVSLNFTQNITLPKHYDGRIGTFVKNSTVSGNIVLHVPELRAGENSTFRYYVNTANIRPPLNFTSAYSGTKILAGENVTVYDTIENVFDNYPFQTNTCIYDINITQVTTPVDFTGVDQDYYFFPSSTRGTDFSNVTYSGDDMTLFWDVLNGGCLNKTEKTDIYYNVSVPFNVPESNHYYMMNTSLEYKLNNTISHLRVIDIIGISEANIDFEKRRVDASHPTLYGSNVTWNVTGYFNTNTSINYNLTNVTFWVSQRNVDGSYTDPNRIDNDTISNEPLKISWEPMTIVNSSSPWGSQSWFFNYTVIPTPIVWFDVNFTIHDDNSQLIARNITRNGNDIYIKEVYLVVGYWLQINKNITSVGNNTYHVRIDVHNKGNQVTPANTVVTIYDFVPSNYNLNGSMSYSVSPWHTTAHSDNNVSGDYNGTLHQWGLIPTGVSGLNASFDQGPQKNENNTWSVDYNVTGHGDYRVLDVFVTGLDPQQVDGAGSTQSVVVSELIDKVQSKEGIFAVVAMALLLLGVFL
jgi:hypothetical protein